MTTYTDLTFTGQSDRGTARLNDLELVKCKFRHCFLGHVSEFGQRAIVQRVQLKKCSAHQCSIGPCLLEDVTVDDLATGDVLLMWSPLFNRVTLRGRIGAITMNNVRWIPNMREASIKRFNEAHEEFYKTVEWALDIREAKFVDVGMATIPARLIRRSPETQMVVTRERALREGWREQLSKDNTFWPMLIDLFLRDGEPDRVLAAPSGAKREKYEMRVRHLHELRALGVVEPD